MDRRAVAGLTAGHLRSDLCQGAVLDPAEWDTICAGRSPSHVRRCLCATWRTARRRARRSASGAPAQGLLARQPQHPGLIADPDEGQYFEGRIA